MTCLCGTVNFTIKKSCPASFLGAIGASWAPSRGIAGAQGVTVDVDRTRAAQVWASSFLFNREAAADFTWLEFVNGESRAPIFCCGLKVDITIATSRDGGTWFPWTDGPDRRRH